MVNSLCKLILVSVLTVSVHGQEVFKPEIVDLKLPPSGKLEGKSLIIDVNKGDESPDNYAEFKIKVKKYASKYISGQLKASLCSDMSMKKGNKSGIQVRLAYWADDKSHERLGGELFANPFIKGKNTTLHFGIMLDPHAEWCKVRIGLINCSGKVKFDLAGFEFKVLFEKKNSDYICQYSDAVKKRPVRRGVMSPNRGQADEENFKVLKDWNVNLMRLQLNTSENWARNNPEKYDKFINEKIEKVIPKVLHFGQKYGVKIIIDLHTSPGSNKMTKTDDGMYNSDKSVKKFIEIWKRIATKFKGHPALYGYDLMNEPKQTRQAKYDYWNLQRMAAEEIRKIDPDLPIYIESNMMCSPLSFYFLPPLKMKNIIYQVHFYEPFSLTHYFVRKKKDIENGSIKYRKFPGQYYGTLWGEDLIQMRKKLSYVRAFEKRHKAKIFVGEFSIPAYAPGAEKYLASCIKIFEEYNWDWTYHCFREAKVWDVEYQGTANDALSRAGDTPRKQVLLKAFRKNN